MVCGLIWIWCVYMFSTICYARLLSMARRNPLRRVIAVQNWWIVAIAKDFQIALASMGYIIGLSLFAISVDEFGLIGGVVAAVLNQFTLWNGFATLSIYNWKLYSYSAAKLVKKLRGWKLKKNRSSPDMAFSLNMWGFCMTPHARSSSSLQQGVSQSS